METDLADRLDGAPELRLVAYTFREVVGHPPAQVWHVPGSVCLLADGERQLTALTRWGAIIAASPREDGIIEPMRMNRPDERIRLTVEQAAAGGGPQWAAEGLRCARDGATLLVNTDLPEGSGVGATGATQAAIRLALRDLALLRERTDGQARRPDPGGRPAGVAMLGDRQVPFDPAASGLRLAVIDTRVRGLPLPPVAEHAPVDEAVAALEAGAIEALGPMLTAAHRALQPDEAQDLAVSTALEAGAIGARMINDGPGRPVLALLTAHSLPDVRSALARAFRARELRLPRLLTISSHDQAVPAA
jgi:galactokinase